MGVASVFLQSTSELLTREAVRRFNVKIVPDYTVLLSFKLTIGRVAITDGEMTTNEAIAHFKLPDDSLITTEYLYLYLAGFDYAKLGSTSSIAEAVNSRMIRDLPIITPPRELAEAFSLRVRGLFGKLRLNAIESGTLANLRDILLPELLSGKVRTPIPDGTSGG
jgi:type I restriction enzyme S subunit